MSVLWISREEKDPIKQNAVIAQLSEGRTNAVGTVTLNSTGATSTTVTAPTVGASSVVVLMPQTTAATSGLTSTYIPSTDVTPRQFIVHHSSSTSTSRVYGWIALG